MNPANVSKSPFLHNNGKWTATDFFENYNLGGRGKKPISRIRDWEFYLYRENGKDFNLVSFGSYFINVVPASQSICHYIWCKKHGLKHSVYFVALSSRRGEPFEKIYPGVFQTGKLPKNQNGSSRRKNQILGIAIKRFNKTFPVIKYKIDAQFEFRSHFVNPVPVSQFIYHYYAKRTFCNCDSFEIKYTDFLFWIFDLQYNKVSVIDISFFASNLIRIQFRFYWFCGFPFIVVIEISIFLKFIRTKIQSKTSNWCKFHVDPRLESLLNGQMKKLGMAPKKKLYWTTFKCSARVASAGCKTDL